MTNFFDRLGQSTLILLGLVIVTAVTILDYLTGVEISFSIFYFLPIILVSWFTDRYFGVFFAVLCTIAWGAADYFGRVEPLLTPNFLFNTSVRLGIFVIIAWLIARLKQSSEQLLIERIKKQILLENFVSLVKHELRNAAGTVKLMLGILEEEALTKEQLELVQSIGEENDRIDNTIDTLSLLTSPIVTKQERYETISLNEMIEPIVQRLNAEKKVTISTNINGIYKIVSSKDIIMHILKNVISNAIKYSPEQGMVWITLRSEMSGVSFICKDSGIGIPVAEQQFLFNPFFRASNAKFRQGSGVGLFVTKELLEKIHGNISVKSKINEGTEIKVTFPYNS